VRYFILIERPTITGIPALQGPYVPVVRVDDLLFLSGQGPIDPATNEFRLDRTPATYTSIVDSQEYSLPLDWFLPGILQHFDLPDVVAAIHPRPAWVLNAVDATEGVLPESAVHQSYLQRISAVSPVLKKLRILTTPDIPVEDKSIYIDWLKNT
jgi:hypothetical protein